MKAEKPFIIGLTGSIGMGKSTVADMFTQLGVPVFDADAAVRELQGPGGALVPLIEAAFPGSTDASGVQREALGALVFGDHAALAQLEAIVHPAVRKVRDAFLTANTDSDLIVFDIPLLLEKSAENDVDTVVVVSAPAEMQRARVLARPGMTEEKFEHILSLQMSDTEKCQRADHVIDNGSTLAQTAGQVQALVKKLRADLRD